MGKYEEIFDNKNMFVLAKAEHEEKFEPHFGKVTGHITIKGIEAIFWLEKDCISNNKTTCNKFWNDVGNTLQEIAERGEIIAFNRTDFTKSLYLHSVWHRREVLPDAIDNAILKWFEAQDEEE